MTNKHQNTQKINIKSSILGEDTENKIQLVSIICMKKLTVGTFVCGGNTENIYASVIALQCTREEV